MIGLEPGQIIGERIERRNLAILVTEKRLATENRALPSGV